MTALAPAPVADTAPALTAPPRRADGLTVDHPRRPPLAPERWTAHSLIRLAAWVGCAAIAFLLVYLPTAFLPREAVVAWAAPVTSLSLVLPAVVAYWLVGRFLELRRPLVELAWSRVAGLPAGLLLGFVLCCVVVGVVWALGGIRFDGTQPPADAVVLFWIAGIQAGIVEEIAFRGLLLRHAEEWVGTWGAVALSSLVFGAAHLPNPGATWFSAVCIAVEAGILFGGLYVLTRSLWVVIGLHLAWNVTQGLLFGIPVSGGTTVGWLRSSPAGPEILSGGRFGVEASVVTPLLLGALGAWLLVLAERRGLVVAPPWRRPRTTPAPREV